MSHARVMNLGCVPGYSRLQSVIDFYQMATHFTANRDPNSDSAQPELSYDKPVPERGTTQHDQGLDSQSPLQESDRKRRRLTTQTLEVIGSFTPSVSVEREAAFDSESETHQVTLEVKVANPEDDAQNKGDKADLVVPSGKVHPIRGSKRKTVVQPVVIHQEQAVHQWKKRCCYCSTSVVIVLALLFTGGTVFCKFMPRDKQQLKKINSSEVLPGDTVLLLCSDNDIRIQIEGVFENDGTSKELDVTLFVVDYDELVVKNKTIRVSGLSLEFRNGPPTFVPPGYKHYELGSNFSYEVTLKDLPASSSLTFRVFGSVADASFYASDSTDIAARNKAIFNQQVTANTSSSIHFERDYASYFITMFDPKSSVGGFKMECSYSVLQTYYKNTDYLPYTEHCRLNSTEEPCYFDFSNKTQMCVLAYNPSSGSTETNPVLLTTSTFTNAKTQLVHPNIFFVSLAVVVIHVLISLCVMVICLCVICFRKCSKCYPYHLIPNTNSI